MKKSMSLKHEPVSEPLHMSAESRVLASAP